MGTVVFAGTSSFAVPTLQTLFEAGHKIAGVVTQPDKPGGRGQALQTPPVKRKAMELQLSVYQPPSLKNDEARSLFGALQPDLIVVVAYGKILPPWLIELPRFGVVNLHGSLLPKYRGAAPIQWAVANGETETGVCTMKIDQGLDTGPVYLCETTPIDPDETVQALSDRLATLGTDLMKRTINGIAAGTLSPIPQDEARASYAPILKKRDGYIDWRLPARTIHNRIRAFNPWPGTVTQFRDSTCKILKSSVGQPVAEPAEAGTIVTAKRSIAAVCGDGVTLELLEVQVPDRKALSGSDFVNGMRVVTGEKLQSVPDN